MGIGEYLQSHLLLTDGAMGTYYAEIKKQESLVSEWANIREPEVVAGIHRAYLRAGAMLLRTNTFAASRQALGVDITGQEEIVRAACRIAKAEISAYTEETGRKCFLAGDIGPLKEILENGENVDVGEEYRTLVDLFLEEGVDALWFETFPDLGRMGEAAAYAKLRKPDLF
ncbi:MAG: homocysteine S-methyltransferase family protein, partial [Lachnospiraceae bacterium]|nr:homocysteine S-methyltransferase family protein [Lachnospiraceae bacterium]